MSTEPIASRWTYWIVFVVLMALLGLTLGLSFLPMHGYEAIPAYTIAVLKALLVVLFFMEVRFTTRLTWVFVGAGFLWLGIMMVLTLSDYTTRGWLPSGERLNMQGGPIISPPNLKPDK